MITAVSWRCSRFLRPGDRVVAAAPRVAVEELLDSAGRDRCLGKKSDRRAGRDQLGIVLFRAGGNQDDRRPVASLKVKLASKVEAALTAEIDVDQSDVGAKLRSASQRLGTVGRQADNCDVLTLQKVSGSAKEPRAVIDNQTAQPHGSRLQGRGGPRIPASWRSSRPDNRHTRPRGALARTNAAAPAIGRGFTGVAVSNRAIISAIV